MAAESFKSRLQRYHSRDVLLIVGDREEIQIAAIHGQVRAVIVTGGLPVRADVVALAKQSGIALVSSPFDTATTLSGAWRGAGGVDA